MIRLLATLMISAVAALGAAPSAQAHESRPAYLELVETQPNHFDVFWKVPALGEARLKIAPRFPNGCVGVTPRIEIATGDASANRWTIDCPAGLAGGRIAIDGIEATLMDALVRITMADGRAQVLKLSSTSPSAAVAAAPSFWGVAGTYFMIGVEHILFGIDHLLFVLTLMLLAGTWWRLLGLITAFTVAHSITLAAATLGHVSLPPAPVEAMIALSIVLAAAEALRPEAERSSLISRAPWVIAFCFGLLHGFGFAGALAEVGLPQGAIPLALLFFNVGVEAGQLVFVAAMAVVLLGVRYLFSERHVTDIRRLLTYGAGGIAAYWLIERVLVVI